MSFADIIALIRKIGPKLPECWPYVLHIISDYKAIAAILADTPVATASFSTKAAKKVSAADAKKFIDLCVKNGVSKAKAAKAIK